MATTDADRRFAEVVLPNLDDAYALARWLCGDAADAEDIVQEACLRALKGIDRYAGGNARAWLLAITRNVALAWLSRSKRKTVDLEEGLESDPALADAATPEQALIDKADEAALEAAIATLPPIFRETFVLREINELSYREIAELTGSPIGTVMSRLARARAHLIRILGSAEPK